MTPQPDIKIKKKAAISIHQQLVTQLAMQITSGALPAGTKLPSVRQLSKKLGIHYNTCLSAYRELEENRLIDIRQGSGVKVATLTPQNGQTPNIEHLELNQMARYFIQQAMNRGYTWDNIREAALQAHRQLEQAATNDTTVVWVDRHADILPLFRTELANTLTQPVEAVTLDDLRNDLAKNDNAHDNQRCYVVSRYHYQALENLLGKTNTAPRIIVVDVTGGQQEADTVRKLSAGALVVIASTSTIVLQQAEAVITALRGHELLIRTVHLSEGEDELKKAVRHGQFILADAITTPLIKKSAGQKPIHTIRAIPESEIKKIKAAL